MIVWHSGNFPEGCGVYDLKSKCGMNDTFDVPGYAPFCKSGFGNYVAGYSGAFASVLTGDSYYFGADMAVGMLYTLCDFRENGDENRITLKDAVSAFCDRLTGSLDGSEDAVDYLFEGDARDAY
jgi:hypothetical protein